MGSKKKQEKGEEIEESPQAGQGQAGQEQAGQEQAEEPREPKTVEQERDELLERLRRLGADYQNYRKRVQKETEQAREFANESLIRDLLPALDDMELALGAAGENHAEDDPLLAGMRLVHDKMLDILSKAGVSRIDTNGKQFDPELHSAMMQEQTDQVEPRTILRELQTGYRLRNRTLRPASVVVAVAPAEEEPAE